MTDISSQEYAGLSADTYRQMTAGRRAPDEIDEVLIEGQKYLVLEHVDNPRTGYQGTIYQRVEGGAIVVAHRGTEEAWKDGVITDGSMVIRRSNPQAKEAIELTGRALEYAANSAEKPGLKSPGVTVTGHSLGGTLAQISAHHFDLRGETFNPYGAASLNLKIPPGANDRMINHVMANDVVSAGSPHYGSVRIYATEKEISVLHQSGYFNNRFGDAITPDLPVVAAGRSLGSHSMHNFLPVDGEGKPDVSVLQDPATRARAAENARMIDNYRGDVQSIRSVITVAAGGPIGWIRDSADHFSERDPAGAPAAREALQRGSINHLLQDGPGSGRGDAAAFSQGGAGDSQQAHVGRLLDAARNGSHDGVRSATDALLQSPGGQEWQARADEHAQLLAYRDVATQQGMRQHEALQQDMAR
ncbi:XVIPCD domain-containing protein [Stenotrophomonas humi]